MQQIDEGKTKIILRFPDAEPGIVRIRSKNIVSWGNENEVPMPGKDALANRTTCNMFRLLKRKRRDVAFIKQTSENEFDSLEARMVKIEAVARFDNHPKGSYHKRNPAVPLGCLPVPVVELFLKTKKGTFGDVALPEGMPDDPLVAQVNESSVIVRHPARSSFNSVTSTLIPYVPGGYAGDLRILLAEVSKNTLIDGTIIRDAWAAFDWNLSDVKIEYGLILPVRTVPRRDYQLVVADVIDNDSWRLQDEYGIEHSKQVARDQNGIQGLEEHYELVADMSETVFEAACE